MIRFLLVIAILNFGKFAFAQQNYFSGTWKAEKKNFEITLKISDVQDFVLYPALLTVKTTSQSKNFSLLLVKKNLRQLAVGKFKYEPDSSGYFKPAIYFSGMLNYFKDNSAATLTFEKNDFVIKENISPSDAFIKNIFDENKIVFTKINDSAWVDSLAEKVLNSPYSGNYYGKMDTLFTENRDLSLKLSGKNNGVISASTNGRPVFEKIYANEKKEPDEFWLEPGLNLIAFFLDEQGKKISSSGNLLVATGKQKRNMNFGDAINQNSTFIVLPVLYSPSDKEFPSNDLASILGNASKNTSVYFYPNDNNFSSSEKMEKTLLRNSVEVGNVTANSNEVLLAIWDDAVEDGDSISLNINGAWVVQGMPVKKKAQFISVKLNAGVNKIIMTGDNEGSISPNTSVLEIIDKNYRKAFKISTDYSKNNLINILYKVE